MKSTFWLAVLVFIAATAWIVARVRRTLRERERAAQEREASLLAGLVGAAAASAAAPVPPDAPPHAPKPVELAPRPARAAPIDELGQQKLLFDSAHKAGEAGEPALCIQLYARLLARYPATAFADAARAAIEAQKKKLPQER